MYGTIESTAQQSACSASVEEATTSVEALTNVAHQMLQSNKELSSRLSSLESLSNRQLLSSSSSVIADSVRDNASTNRRPRAPHPLTDKAMEIRFTFDFDEDLSQSWVYSRALRRKSFQSLSSSAANSFAWSCLSELSLANVSNVSVLSLPITVGMIINPEHYGLLRNANTTIDQVGASQTLLAGRAQQPSPPSSAYRDPPYLPNFHDLTLANIFLFGRVAPCFETPFSVEHEENTRMTDPRFISQVLSYQAKLPSATSSISTMALISPRVDLLTIVQSSWKISSAPLSQFAIKSMMQRFRQVRRRVWAFRQI